MKWKQILDEAFQKGEKMKEELLVELINSKLFSELVRNEKFVGAVTAVVNAKAGLEKRIQTQIKHVFSFIDIPSRKEVDSMVSKVSRLEHQLDRLGQQLRNEASRQAVHATKAKAAPVRKTKASAKPSKKR